MDPGERFHADVAGGGLPRGKDVFLRGRAFLGWAIEPAAQFEAQSVASVDLGGDRVEAVEKQLAVGHSSDADIKFRLREVRHHIGRGSAAADIADVEHHAGQFGGNLSGGEQELSEGENGAATVVGHFGGVGRAAVAGCGEPAGSFAGMDDVAVRASGFVEQREGVVSRGLSEKRFAPVRADFLVGGQQNFPSDLGCVRCSLECLQGGVHDEDPAFHVDHAGTAQGVGIEPGAGLKCIIGLVNGIEVTVEQHALFGLRAHDDAHGAGRCTRQDRLVDLGRWKGAGEVIAQAEAHPLEASTMPGPGVDVGPAFEQVHEFGSARGEGGDGRGQTHFREFRCSRFVAWARVPRCQKRGRPQGCGEMKQGTCAIDLGVSGFPVGGASNGSGSGQGALLFSFW